MIAKEFLIELDCILNFFVLDDFLKLFLEVRKKTVTLDKFKVVLFFIILILRLVVSLSELKVRSLIRVIARTLPPALGGRDWLLATIIGKDTLVIIR